MHVSITIPKDTYKKNVKIFMCNATRFGGGDLAIVKERRRAGKLYYRDSGLNFGGTIMPVICFCFLAFLDLPAPD